MNDDIKNNLQEIYDLGFAHGYELAQKDIELKQLTKEVEELQEIERKRL